MTQTFRLLCVGLTMLFLSANTHAQTITQNASQSFVAGSVSCNAAGVTSDNGYSRGFDLAAFGISSPWFVSSVSFGVETATAGPNSAGMQPVVVNIYDGWSLSAGNLVYGTLAGTANTMVADGTNFFQNVNVNATINSGFLAMEVFIADATGAAGAGHAFFIGSNNLGQTGPSFIRSVGCGLPNNGNLAGIGFPNMHVLMNVTGAAIPEPGMGGLMLLSLAGFVARRRR